MNPYRYWRRSPFTQEKRSLLQVMNQLRKPLTVRELVPPNYGKFWRVRKLKYLKGECRK
jgi:hypothetical protein